MCKKNILKKDFIHSIKKNMRNQEVFYEGIYSVKILFFFFEGIVAKREEWPGQRIKIQ